MRNAKGKDVSPARATNGQFVSTNPKGSRWDELNHFLTEGKGKGATRKLLRAECLLDELIRLTSRGTIAKAICKADKVLDTLPCGYGCGTYEPPVMEDGGDWPRCPGCGGS